MDKRKQAARARWARAHDIALAHYARRVAARCIANQGKWPSRQAAYSAQHCIKWQCMLDHDEAADLDIIRAKLAPGLSRYAFVRGLLLQAIDLGKEEILEQMGGDAD